LYPFAWRHKIAGLRDGYITKESLWDRLVFDFARASVVGEGAGSIRGVIVGGGKIPCFNSRSAIKWKVEGSLEAKIVEPARIAFSVPVVNAHVHPLVAGPVLATHPLDLQTFPISTADPFGLSAPVGPPSMNIEAKLVEVDDDGIENGADPVGVLQVRGPPVGRLTGVVEESEGAVGVQAQDQWVDTGEKARVLRNGTFQILRQAGHLQR
jgi:long-chain acyl-CoA synthetase